MAKNEPRLEKIVYGTDRRYAQKIRNAFMKILAKDKKADGVRLTYIYKPFRKRADYTIEGSDKTVRKCLKAFRKLVLKEEKAVRAIEAQKYKAQPMAVGKYYTMKTAKERKGRV